MAGAAGQSSEGSLLQAQLSVIKQELGYPTHAGPLTPVQQAPSSMAVIGTRWSEGRFQPKPFYVYDSMRNPPKIVKEKAPTWIINQKRRFFKQLYDTAYATLFTQKLFTINNTKSKHNINESSCPKKVIIQYTESNLHNL